MTDWSFCPHCGTRLAPDDSACRGCGIATGAAVDTSAEEEAARLDAELAAIADELREALAPQLQLLKPLGQGGMGTVFLARDPALKRMVVVKVLSPELAGDYAARKRFEREAEAAASVAHPNVVSIHQVGQLARSGTSYFVMQHVQGQTLAEAFPAGSVAPEHRANRIVADVALALAAAHARGLVHRDIKPSNIMLEAETDRAIVLDFGISAAVRSDAKAQETKLTAQGASIGTPQYMSPEQAAGEEVTAQSDVYSLGLVAFQLVTGRPAFTADNAMALIAAHLKDTPPAVRELRPDLDPHVADLINRCLAKDPSDRPTAVDLGRALAPGATSIVEWPPPGLELIHGRAYRYLVGVTTFAILEAVYAVVTSIALDEGSPDTAGIIGVLGGFLMLIYAMTIARRARHLPRGVRDARRVGYPRRVVWDVAIDRRPDTAHLVNRVGPFASLSGDQASSFLRRRRLGILLTGTLLVVTLLSPVLLLAGLASWYFWVQAVPLVLAWPAMWWCERPERRYRKRYVRQETARSRVEVSREVTAAWLQAAGAPAQDRVRARVGLDRVYAGAFNVSLALVIVLGFVWFSNLVAVAAEFQSDPPGDPTTHVIALQENRHAARTPMPVLGLDEFVPDIPGGNVELWAAVLRDSLHREAHALEDSLKARLRDTRAAIGPAFTGMTAARAADVAEVIGTLDRFAPLEAWRSLGDSTLPLLWYRDAIVHLRAGVEGDTVTTAANASRSRPLRHLHVLGTLELYRVSFALASGDTATALARAAGVLRVARNLLRDPLTAGAGLETVVRTIPVLRAIATRPAGRRVSSDVAALESFEEEFGTAFRAYGSRSAIKAMTETERENGTVDTLLVLAADTTILPVHRLALVRAAVLGSCFQGHELFFGTGGGRERLVEDVSAAAADLPLAGDYADLYRALHWDGFTWGDARRFETVGKVLWVLPRVLHCQAVMPPAGTEEEEDGSSESRIEANLN